MRTAAGNVKMAAIDICRLSHDHTAQLKGHRFMGRSEHIPVDVPTITVGLPACRARSGSCAGARARRATSPPSPRSGRSRAGRAPVGRARASPAAGTWSRRVARRAPSGASWRSPPPLGASHWRSHLSAKHDVTS